MENTKLSDSSLDLFNEDIIKGKTCPYCNNPSIFVDSKIIYGRSYGMIYLCKSCDAYVGVHKGTSKALGRLADQELRFWKKETHRHFDKIWQSNLMSRRQAYQNLSLFLNLSIELTHIGMFTKEYCVKTIEWSKQQLNRQ